jgi:hypothetical protein
VDKGKKDAWINWGAWMRFGQPSGFATRNALGRLQDEGAGAGTGGRSRDFIPIRDCPKHLLEVDMTYKQRLNALEKSCVYLRFVKRIDPNVIAKRLGISRATYFRNLATGVDRLVVVNND